MSDLHVGGAEGGGGRGGVDVEQGGVEEVGIDEGGIDEDGIDEGGSEEVRIVEVRGGEQELVTLRVECFFDYSSPFAYLGTTQIERVAREEGASLVWRPFLLGALFRAIGTPDVPVATFSEAKRRAVLLDLRRWARVHGVGFRFASRFPLRSVDALRLTHAVPDEVRSAFVHRVMRTAWVDDEGLEREVLARCLADVGLDDSWLARADEPEVKAALRATTEEAERRGAPGAPTFFVQRGERESLVWGQDRLDFVRLALRGELEP